MSLMTTSGLCFDLILDSGKFLTKFQSWCDPPIGHPRQSPGKKTSTARESAKKFINFLVPKRVKYYWIAQRDHYVWSIHICQTPLQGKSALCLPHSHSVKVSAVALWDRTGKYICIHQTCVSFTRVICWHSDLTQYWWIGVRQSDLQWT